MNSGKISKEEMLDAINNSGYLIEQRIEYCLLQKRYFVETSDVYFDEDSSKSREIDITAIKGFKLSPTEDHLVFPYLIIECENNHQPIAFFRNNQSSTFIYDEIKYSGIPEAIYAGKLDPVPVDEFLDFSDFHHYKHSSNYTQYCSFQYVNKSPGKWIASHLDGQHDSFNSLIKCLEYKIKDHYNSYVLPKKGIEEQVNLQFYYPIIVLQGELFEAYEIDGKLHLEEKRFLSFRKQTVKNGVTKSYKIDVLTEGYLPTYLDIIDKEIEEIAEKLKNRWADVRKSMLEITSIQRDMAEYRTAFGIPFPDKNIE